MTFTSWEVSLAFSKAYRGGLKVGLQWRVCENTEIIFVLLFIKYCIIFIPTAINLFFAHLCICSYYILEIALLNTNTSDVMDTFKTNQDLARSEGFRKQTTVCIILLLLFYHH